MPYALAVVGKLESSCPQETTSFSPGSTWSDALDHEGAKLDLSDVKLLRCVPQTMILSVTGGHFVPETTLATLQPYASLIHSYLEKSVAYAFDLLDTAAPKRPDGAPEFDPYFFSHAVRWQVSRQLKEADFEHQQLEGDFESVEELQSAPRPDMKYLSMSGLQIGLRGFSLKIWKARQGGLPLAGSSEPRKLFYQQNLGFADGHAAIKNLVLLWDVDEARGLTLDLVAPNPVFTFTERTEWKHSQLWSIPVPPYATFLASQQPPDADHRYLESFGRSDIADETQQDQDKKDQQDDK